MLGLACVERVGRQHIIAAEQSKPAGGNNDVRILAFQADRAITVFDLYPGRKIHFEPNRAAMTTAQMRADVFETREFPAG